MVELQFKKGMRTINTAVVDMVMEKIESTDLTHSISKSKLVSWLNGVATCERNHELKVELKRLRQLIQQMG